MLDCEGPYRLTGTAGDGSSPPAAAIEAARRLREYLTDTGAWREATGMSNAAATKLSDGDFSIERPATWIARAMQLSGAADLLRPYRRLGVT